MPSHNDDLLQLVDLLVGSVAYLKKKASNPRKLSVAKKAKELVLISDQWMFEPKK